MFTETNANSFEKHTILIIKLNESNSKCDKHMPYNNNFYCNFDFMYC